MLQLPESVQIQRFVKAEQKLLDKARKWLEREQRTPGIHASDLLDPRQAYWRHVKPQPISDRLVPMFLIGKVLHAFVLNAIDEIPMDLNKTDEGSFISEELGCSFSPDKVTNGKPRELKTSRSFYEPKTVKDVDFYLEQLLIYMAGMDSTEGQIWVLYTNLKNEEGITSPQFRCFKVKISAKDLKHYKKEVKETSRQLQWAIDNKSPEVLPLCRKFKCGQGYCEWWQDCQPQGRFGIDKRKWEV